MEDKIITVSHNELVVACQKAFEALGFNQAQWEDAGDAIGWLAVHGLPLPAGFVDRLGSMRPAEALPKMIYKKPGEPMWEANRESAVSYFPILVDYASVHARRFKSCHMLIMNCRDIDLIWPYIVKVHRRGFHISVRWKLNQQTEQIVAFGSDIQLYRRKSELALDAVALTIKEVDDADQTLEQLSGVMAEVENLIDGATLQKNFQFHTANGIDIDKTVWQTLGELGKRILVEATEESERRGAGGV